MSPPIGYFQAAATSPSSFFSDVAKLRKIGSFSLENQKTIVEIVERILKNLEASCKNRVEQRLCSLQQKLQKCQEEYKKLQGSLVSSAPVHTMPPNCLRLSGRDFVPFLRDLVALCFLFLGTLFIPYLPFPAVYALFLTVFALWIIIRLTFATICFFGLIAARLFIDYIRESRSSSSSIQFTEQMDRFINKIIDIGNSYIEISKKENG